MQRKVAVPEARVEAMANFKKPHTQKKLRAFLGDIGYYRRFIGDFAKLSSILTPASSPNVSNPAVVIADGGRLYGKLCNNVILTVPNVKNHFQVQMDASHEAECH